MNKFCLARQIAYFAVRLVVVDPEAVADSEVVESEFAVV
jgi:hypothetical protein